MASAAPDGVLQLWEAVPYLERLPAEVIRALADVAVRQHCAEREIIFLEGDPVAGLFLIEEGVVKITRHTKEGREHILLVLDGGDTFNDVAALDGGPNPATAMALSEVTLWRVARRDLQVVARRYPDLAWALIESVARRTRYLLGLVQDLSMRNVRGRLAHLLLEQAAAGQRGEVPRLFTQEEMASRLGTVREVVGRALRGLANDGIIAFDRHRIVVLDAERLAQEAEI